MYNYDYLQESELPSDCFYDTVNKKYPIRKSFVEFIRNIFTKFTPKKSLKSIFDEFIESIGGVTKWYSFDSKSPIEKQRIIQWMDELGIPEDRRKSFYQQKQIELDMIWEKFKVFVNYDGGEDKSFVENENLLYYPKMFV